MATQVKITLGEAEANGLLAVLSELPIKYLSIVEQVRQMLAQNMAQDLPSVSQGPSDDPQPEGA